MPSKKQFQAAKVEAAKAAGEPVVETVEPRDLNDAKVQAEILSPKAFPITIGGEKSALYPLPANARCEVAWEFWPDVTSGAHDLGFYRVPEKAPETDEAKAHAGMMFLSGCARTIVRRPTLKERFTCFIARAEHAPDAEPDADVLALRAKLIDHLMEPEELLLALSRFYITEVARPKELTQPK